ncbi:hypothetical protein [Roseobacter sp. HKCCA0882]|uniref:hypothetical protein n=1 Tax=Roseobacter sp. HKCCA0882 TaxID=3120337 RepID=UPI0030ED7A95
MTDVVTVLRFEEPARFDADRLERLCRDIGETQAEYEVAVGLERIMIVLAQIDCVDSTLERKKIFAEIADSASKIGMANLARVARDVHIVMARQDMAAIGATLARLRRVGERSVYAIYDIEDMSV